jgi:hypothetical protein
MMSTVSTLPSADSAGDGRHDHGVRESLEDTGIESGQSEGVPNPVIYDPAWERRSDRQPNFDHVVSQACTRAQIDSAPFQEWVRALDQPRLYHRKQWEWCYILQALDQGGAVEPGKRGLGFGVGTEPMASYLASRGCAILATDLPVEDGGHDRWSATGQHVESLERINEAGLCDPEEFARLVTFRPVNMNAVPDDLTGFDFVWSSCAMEHLGDLGAGEDFVMRSMECLDPGGLGVHTTELDVTSHTHTVESGPTVAYRRSDLEGLIERLRGHGHEIEAVFGLGDTEEDRHVDVPPYTETHLKTALAGHAITSFGLVVRKSARRRRAWSALRRRR